VPTVVILPRVEVQIVDVLEHTLEEFGEAKYLEYRELIGPALKTLEVTPMAGKRRTEIHPDAWTRHIARPGRKARHLFLYRIRDVVELPASFTTRWIYLTSGPRNGNESGPPGSELQRWPETPTHRCSQRSGSC